MTKSANLQKWQDYYQSHDPAKLSALLSEDVVFYSPVVLTPQRGKQITMAYLLAADQVLNNDSFVYTRELVCEDQIILEFELELNGIQVNGVDIMQWNNDGQITEFKVMVRPLKAVHQIHEEMGKMLQKMQKAKS